MTKIVLAVFETIEQAHPAVEELTRSGFKNDAISLVAGTREDIRRYFEERPGADPSGDKSKVTGVGALMGGLGGLLVGMALVTIPGLGPVLAAGQLATLLAATGVGAAGGGLAGALAAAGVPEDSAKNYADRVLAGGALLVVRTSDEQAAQAAEILNRLHPLELIPHTPGWYTAQSQRMSSFEAGSPLQSESRLDDSAADSSLPSTVNFSDEEEHSFREHFTQSYSAAGASYEEYRPGYLYGYQLARSGRYRGLAWEAIAPDARREWEETYPGKAWLDFEPAIRIAWSQASHPGD